MTDITTTLTAAQITSLTNKMEGPKVGRASDKDAAIKRFAVRFFETMKATEEEKDQMASDVQDILNAPTVAEAEQHIVAILNQEAAAEARLDAEINPAPEDVQEVDEAPETTKAPANKGKAPEKAGNSIPTRSALCGKRFRPTVKTNVHRKASERSQVLDMVLGDPGLSFEELLGRGLTHGQISSTLRTGTIKAVSGK